MVRVTEPHWYKLYIDNGCVICGYGYGEHWHRMPGKRPKDPLKRFEYSGDHACNEHFI